MNAGAPRSRRAVALRYAPERDDAPVIEAAGKGSLAERIIALAQAHNIPIREDRALVETLGALDIGDEIPPLLYKVVAEVLAHVYRVDARAGGRQPSNRGQRS